MKTYDDEKVAVECQHANVAYALRNSAWKIFSSSA